MLKPTTTFSSGDLLYTLYVGITLEGEGKSRRTCNNMAHQAVMQLDRSLKQCPAMLRGHRLPLRGWADTIAGRIRIFRPRGEIWFLSSRGQGRPSKVCCGVSSPV